MNEEHDIFGDGVDVAARLEGLAETGGICVSRVVRDQVRYRLGISFEDLGEKRVKNIARSVCAYRALDLGASAAKGISPKFVRPRQGHDCDAALCQYERRP
jgi:class 3 adenylate cyclase